MIKHLQDALAGHDAFVVTVSAHKEHFSRVSLVAVCDIGIVVEGDVHIPWTSIYSLKVEFI